MATAASTTTNVEEVEARPEERRDNAKKNMRISINDRSMPSLSAFWDHFSNSGTISIDRIVLQNAGFYGQQNCRGLAKNAGMLQKLRHLTIQESKLGPRGVKIIVEELLMKNSSSNKNKSSEDADDCAHLQDLDLATCRMGHFGAQSLAKFMPYVAPTLLKLNIQSNNLGDDGIWKLASALPCVVNLKQLNLAENQISDTGLCELGRQCLPSMTKLRKLILKGNHIKGTSTADSFISALAQESCAIQKLDLSHNQIQASAATAVAIEEEEEEEEEENGGLPTANLGSSIIQSNCGSLEVFDLSHNLLGDDGAVAIANSLDQNIDLKLQQLLLKDNQIGDMGAGAFIDAFDVSAKAKTESSSSSEKDNTNIMVTMMLNLDDNPDISQARVNILKVLQKHQHQLTETNSKDDDSDGSNLANDPNNSMKPEEEVLILREEVRYLRTKIFELEGIIAKMVSTTAMLHANI